LLTVTIMRGGKVIHQLRWRVYYRPFPSPVNNFGNGIRAGGEGELLSNRITPWIEEAVRRL